MKKNYVLLLMTTLVIFSFLQSCQKDELEFSSEEIISATENDLLKNSYSGKKLKNPYAVENMKKAFKNVKEKNKANKNKVEEDGPERYIIIEDDYTVETSHLYLKFEPATEEEVFEMKKDSTMVLFDYPLDVEFTDEYLDNRTSSDLNAIPIYYTSVPVEKEISANTSPQVIEELYIPEEDPYFDSELQKGKVSKEDKEELLDRLIIEAFKLTDNEDQLEDTSSKEDKKDQNKSFGGYIGEKWTPSGIIKIWDNTFSEEITENVFSHYEYFPCETNDTDLQQPGGPGGLDDGSGTCQRAVYITETTTTDGKFVPLEGAQVLMRQWFTIRQAITDKDGKFTTASLRGTSRYIIQWERYHYSIRNGSVFQAETRGPRVKEQAWIKNIKGGDDEYHGMIHTAAHDYYYGDRFGLTSPPRNSMFGRQMKIAARETAPWGISSSYSHVRGDLTLGIAAHIHIKAWQEPSDRVYGTTIHELGHAAHSVVDRHNYDNIVRDAWVSPWQGGAIKHNNRRLLETWARTVEILFSIKRYKDKFGLDYKYYQRNYQDQTTLGNIHYTSAGYDMTEEINQREHRLYGNGSTLYPIDRVSGYTVKQLEEALEGADSWWQWRDNIRNRFNNPTEIYLNELFANWPN